MKSNNNGGGLIDGFFGKVQEYFRENRRSKVTEFSHLVKAVAEGRKFDPGDAAQILDAAGKTPNDLEAAVALEKKRADWRRMEAELPGLRAESKELADKLHQAKARHDEALRRIGEEYEREATPLRAQHAAVDAKIWGILIQNPREKLLNTSPEFEKTEINKALAAAPDVQALRSLEKRLREVNSQVAGLTRKLRDASAPVDTIVGRRQPDVSQIEAKLKATRAEQAEVQRSINAWHAAKDASNKRVGNLQAVAISA